MKRYFPFLRGKQHELMALRNLAGEIAEKGNVIPIIEPVNANPATRNSLSRYIEASMPFLFVCNPFFGEFKNHSERLHRQLIAETLIEYDNWTPALQVQPESHAKELSSFLDRYKGRNVAVIYQGLPPGAEARSVLADTQIVHHVFLENRVPANYISAVAENRRVLIVDTFNRQPRNADYPGREFFNDMNTRAGNPRGVDFGDFSIVGNHFTKEGGRAHAVALHHIHFQDGPGPLDVSHFISDRTETSVDIPGKTIEALAKLVGALDELRPNDTSACEEYRGMYEAEEGRGLGYMKRLAIRHHLEVMLRDGVQL